MEGINKINADVPEAEKALDPQRQVAAAFISGIRCVQRGSIRVIGLGNPFEGSVVAVTGSNADEVLDGMQKRFGGIYPELFSANDVVTAGEAEI